MQSREFDEAMYKGFDKAKWAELDGQNEEIQKVQATIQQRLKNMPKLVKASMREIIAANEVVIPSDKAEEIQSFVDQQRRFSVPEQNIRRKVKKKFGIIVI